MIEFCLGTNLSYLERIESLEIMPLRFDVFTKSPSDICFNMYYEDDENNMWIW
jgi:hypothetical protein